MTTIGKLHIAAKGETEIEFTRAFDAPRNLVYDAMTKPEILKRWLFGPDGWSLAVCEIDPRPGGKIRYAWDNGCNGANMALSGVIQEAVAPERLVHTEIFDEDWTDGETLVTTDFTEDSGKTTLTLVVRYNTSETRDTVLNTPMAEGMAMGYDRLDPIFASMQEQAKTGT